MKIMALSKEFFINRWNVFDLVIVLASLLDLGLEIGSGLSVLRGMRLVSKVILFMLYVLHFVSSMYIYKFLMAFHGFPSNAFDSISWISYYCFSS